MNAGAFELRFNNEAGHNTLATAPINVTDVQASLTAPVSVAAGSEFAVSWTGPAYTRDFITIVAPDAEESAYLSYFDIRNENPGKLTAPAEPAGYELRYVVGSGPRVIARTAIEVVAR